MQSDLEVEAMDERERNRSEEEKDISRDILARRGTEEQRVWAMGLREKWRCRSQRDSRQIYLHAAERGYSN